MDIKIKIPSGGMLTIPHYPIDMIGVHERAKSFTTRSIKNQSKIDALYMAISMTDLTTLEGADTPEKIKQLCGKGKNPVPQNFLDKINSNIQFTFKDIPKVAAICVYPEMVPYAVKELEGSGIEIASVATAFPAGQLPLDIKLMDVKRAVKYGATEIDMVIDRGAFLRGNYQKVFDEIIKVKDICQNKAHLKVILETGELKTLDNIRAASWLAMEAGADFIKTSTGKVSPAATMPFTLVMLQAIGDYQDQTGKKIGMKPAGGIKTAKEAIHYLVMVNEVLGRDWLHPSLFRFGASSLLNDLLKQIFKQASGKYFYDDIFSVD